MNLPNALSGLRIALAPLFWFFYQRGWLREALLLLLLCALSDVADGWIARRFHQESELGKILDPVGDKLIQGAMLLCLCRQTPAAWPLLGLYLLRELLLAGLGLQLLRRTGRAYGARWYGKLCTVAIYTTMLLLLFLPDYSARLQGPLLLICSMLVLFCLGMYGSAFLQLLRQERDRPADGSGQKFPAEEGLQ